MYPNTRVNESQGMARDQGVPVSRINEPQCMLRNQGVPVARVNEPQGNVRDQGVQIPRTKRPTDLRLVGRIGVTCRSKIAKIVSIGIPRWPPQLPS